VVIRKYAVVADCGRAINPLILDGQVHGGVAQGLGNALYEEVIYDDGGQIVTGSLMDYLVPTAMEVPRIEVAHIETPAAGTVGGYKGAGESGTIGVPAAIANAVSDAVGTRIYRLPVTPDRLRAVLATQLESSR
jgi:carbon-monoxide dehydrogenase large subunit